jgi:cation transporter-like permease
MVPRNLSEVLEYALTSVFIGLTISLLITLLGLLIEYLLKPGVLIEVILVVGFVYSVFALAKRLAS